MPTPAAFLLAVFALLPSAFTHLQGKDYWFKVGSQELDEAIKLRRNEGRAKNVIIFVGDGMGVNTVTASRIYRAGEESLLSFEKFPHVGMLKTYSTDKQVPDSACTATALFSGVKSNYETVSVTADVLYDDCDASLKEENRLESVMMWAQTAGKSTGIVTTTRITHATPAATYAKCPSRHWECDSRIPEKSKHCKDIGRQLVEDYPGKNFNVILGGGRQCLSNRVNITGDDPIEEKIGVRSDNVNIIQQWANDKRDRGANIVVAQNTSQLRLLDTEKTDFLIGIFSNSHFPYEYKRDKSEGGIPSLPLMATTALNILKKNENGFLLMVEGGMIDQAHHLGSPRMALEETLQFSDSINETVQLLQESGILDETLIIVTSDHGHTLSINGYAPKGNNILGVATNSKVDGVPWTTLTYGVGTKENYQYTVEDGKVKRQDPRELDTTSYDFRPLSVAPHDISAHGGGDVIAFAQGPMAHLIHSVHEQNYIAFVISYAAKIGPYAGKTPCPNHGHTDKPLFLVYYAIPIFIVIYSINK